MRVTTPAPRDAWRNLLTADRGAVLCQAPEWTDALCSGGAFADASRHYALSDGRSLVLPLVQRRGPLRVLGSMPDAWGMGGLLADAPVRPADVRAIGADLAGLAALRVTVRPNPLHAGVWASAGGTTIPRRAHVLDLSGGPDAVWGQGLSGSARRSVRKAERSGLTVRCGNGPELRRDYRRLFDLSVRRWAQAQHEPVALARARARRRDPPGKLDRLAANLEDRLRIWLAYADGLPVAGIVVLLGPAASYTRGAMDRAHIASSGANELLHWRAIQEACAAGCTAYHMGETGQSVPLARFKEKFGARPVDYAEHRFERLPLTRADAAVRGAVKRAIGFRDVA
jgi:hypothetical protein